MTLESLEARLLKIEHPVKERNSELIFYLGLIILSTGALIFGSIAAPVWIEICKWSAIAYGAGRIVKKTAAEISNNNGI